MIIASIPDPDKPKVSGLQILSFDIKPSEIATWDAKTNQTIMTKVEKCLFTISINGFIVSSWAVVRDAYIVALKKEVPQIGQMTDISRGFREMISQCDKCSVHWNKVRNRINERLRGIPEPDPIDPDVGPLWE